MKGAIGSFVDDDARDRYVQAYRRALAQMEPAARTIDVSTAYGTVRTYEWNRSEAAAPPVLLLPGRSSGVPMWQENLPDFVPHRRVIAVDALGDAGLSVQHAPLHSMAEQAAWIDQALTGLGEDLVHLVGHSFGGATAAACALRLPKRLASVALLEPVFTLSWPPPSTFFWTTVASLPVPPSWRDRALARIGGVDIGDIRERTPLSDMITSASRGFRAALPVPRVLTDDQLASLRAPAYVAIAEEASLAGGDRAIRRAHRIPGAQVQRWRGTTHSLPMQVHTELAARLTRFWDDSDAALDVAKQGR